MEVLLGLNLSVDFLEKRKKVDEKKTIKERFIKHLKKGEVLKI